MKVIILAGGKGTRLPDSARDIPKALVEVRGKPMIDHLTRLLGSHGFSDLLFALGFRADMIIDYLDGRHEYVVEPEPLGTGGALKFASSDLNEPFLAMNGDIITDFDFRGFHGRYQELGTIPNMIAVYETDDARDFGLAKLEGDHILKFQEKPVEKRSGFVNTGFYILDPQALRAHPGKSFSIEHDIFPRLAQARKLGYFIHRGCWTDAGTEERLRRVNSG